MSKDTNASADLYEAAKDGVAVLSHAGAVSLEGMHGSVDVPHHQAGFWRQWRAFVGPAILISVGYMDPGNWGTDLQSGAQFKFGLLWVVGLASLMAIFMQVISARLGVVTGKDLAQCCRDWYPRWTRWPNWLFCELAIGACDLAEVLGSAVAINIMFHIPAVLGGHHHGAGRVAAAGPATVWHADHRGDCRCCWWRPSASATTSKSSFSRRLTPVFWRWGAPCSRPSLRQAGMLYVAIGIIGATVMPHNLYLHSALVQSRKLQKDEASIRTAIRFNTIDSVAALTVAFFVNAAIMVLAAMVFYGKTSVTVAGGQVVTFSPESDWIRIASLTLAPLLGTAVASTLFVVALLASGQSSTITGTLAGQVVMEGFMHWRIRPWLRRLITRTLAIIPAVLIIGVRGDSSVTDLLDLSQVVLALQLPLAMFPLLHFTSSRKRMGAWKNGWFLLIAGWGERHPDHRDGHLGIARRPQIGLASHQGRMKLLNWDDEIGL